MEWDISRIGFEPALSRCMTQIETFLGNPVRLRLESKTKEDYIRGVGVLCPSIHTKQVPTHPHSH